jgi:hypothetical protein
LWCTRRGRGDGPGHRGAHGRRIGSKQSDEGDTTTAEGQSLTAREAVREVLASEHADVLRESVAVMVNEIMELEVAQLAGAELGERAPERRQAQRNGYRERRWDRGLGDRVADPEVADG